MHSPCVQAVNFFYLTDENFQFIGHIFASRQWMYFTSVPSKPYVEMGHEFYANISSSKEIRYVWAQISKVLRLLLHLISLLLSFRFPRFRTLSIHILRQNPPLSPSWGKLTAIPEGQSYDSIMTHFALGWHESSYATIGQNYSNYHVASQQAYRNRSWTGTFHACLCKGAYNGQLLFDNPCRSSCFPRENYFSFVR